MSDREAQFEDTMLRFCGESRELGYFPADFIGMVKREGAVPLARRLVKTLELQSGLLKLAEIGRLDLSIESLMLQPQFGELFKDTERRAAEGRLWQAKNEPLIAGKSRKKKK